MRTAKMTLALTAGALAATAALTTPATAAERPNPKPVKFCTYIVDTGQGGCFRTEAQAKALGGAAEYKDLGRIWSDINSGGSQFTFRGSELFPTCGRSLAVGLTAW
ncbi:hypothetical protein [Streptomyces sp. NPDC006879]|uniref:hypothetical protein n=1 Tax=Streptomyces sp. NPDC006879 TaxID=3364767 RepID=UPI00368EF08C